MIRSILVPLDGSTFAEHALPLAVNLARRAGAIIHLVRVHLPAVPETPGGMAMLHVYDLHLRQDEQAYLADLTRRVTEHGPMDVKSILLDGDVPTALKDYAERESIDLVVMSTHGRGAMGRFWLGSVADELAANLPQPVLLVRPGEGKPDLHRETELKSIVVPLDGTELAEKAVEPALELGKLFNAEYTLVRVNPPAILSAYLPEGVGSASVVAALEQADEIERREGAEANRYLDDVAGRMVARGARVQTHVVVEEQAAAGILAEAEAKHADLIAIETHGRRGLSRLFMGSVADKVIRKGAVPVLLHRAAR